MANSSNIVLRWEIGDATARFTAGKVESAFNKGGFKWIAAMEGTDMKDFTLECDREHYGSWKCELQVDIAMLQSDGTFYTFPSHDPCSLDDNNTRWLRKGLINCSGRISATFLINDTLTFEIRINIISSEDQPITSFDAPNRKSNVILTIGDKKLHVYKELLAFHSPVFHALFFGGYAESGKEEVEIKEVVYEEFVALLHFMYGGTVKITDRTVLPLLKLADKFDIKQVMEQSKLHLTESKSMDLMKKLLLVEQYRLDSIRDLCLQSVTSSAELIEKMKTSDYDILSNDSKAAICDKIKKLSTD